MRDVRVPIGLSTIRSPAIRRRLTSTVLKIHTERIYDELRQAGAVTYDLLLPETHYLPFVIHPDEHVKGSVYGKYSQGRGVLVATDRRIIFIDKKPLFVHVDEIRFAVVGGVTMTHAGVSSIVTLHTPMGDYKIRTFNLNNALNFVNYVESKCLKDRSPSRQLKDRYKKGDSDDKTS